MSQNVVRNNVDTTKPVVFNCPTIKQAVGELLQAYQSGALDNMPSHVVIRVSGGNMSPATEQFYREKP